MAISACVSPKLKEFKFRVELNGLEAALVEEFSPGNRNIAVVEHAGAGQNHPCKEAGMLSYDDAVLKNVVPIDGTARKYWDDWMNQAQNPKTGDGLQPASYRRNFTMYELNNEGNPVRAWEFYKAFPVRYSLGNRSSMSDKKNVIEEIHIAYEYFELRLINAA